MCERYYLSSVFDDRSLVFSVVETDDGRIVDALTDGFRRVMEDFTVHSQTELRNDKAGLLLVMNDEWNDWKVRIEQIEEITDGYTFEDEAEQDRYEAYDKSNRWVRHLLEIDEDERRRIKELGEAVFALLTLLVAGGKVVSKGGEWPFPVEPRDLDQIILRILIALPGLGNGIDSNGNAKEPDLTYGHSRFVAECLSSDLEHPAAVSPFEWNKGEKNLDVSLENAENQLRALPEVFGFTPWCWREDGKSVLRLDAGQALTPHATESLSDTEQQVVECVRRKGQRMVTAALLVELSQFSGSIQSEGYIKQVLSGLVKRRVLNNRSDTKPKGYGLPEWGNT